MTTAIATIPARPIKTRRIRFSYPEDRLPRRFTRSGDPVTSHVVAVLSALFPEGEDFFVRSVRNYRDQIEDPELKKQVAGFIGQEAIHGREHRRFNDRLAQLGYRTHAVDRFTKHALGLGARYLPQDHQLAITAALEHYTATLAEVLLSSAEAQASFDADEVRLLLMWHAVEESEHKAVAFDVYQSVSGSHRTRVGVMNRITVGFLGLVVLATTVSLLFDGDTYRHPGRVLRGLRDLPRSPWLQRDVGRRLRDYNRRDFHPDDHDTTELLEHWRTELFAADGRLADRLQGAA